MKYIVTILLLNVLITSTVHARNCAVAVHNPHCTGSAGHSSSTTQTTTLTGAVGQTPNQSKTNSHLGSGTQTQHPVIQVNPIVSHQIVGQAQAPTKPAMKIPPKAKIVKPPVIYTYTAPIATPVLPVTKVPPRAHKSKPPLQIYMVPNKVVSGNFIVPQQPVTIAPPKTFTSPPRQQVNAIPGKVISGQSQVPQQPITIAPPKTFTSPPQQQVNAIPGKVISGQSQVPQQPITIAPPKSFTSPPQIQVYPITTPVFIGHAVGTLNPVVNVPSKPVPQTPTPLPNKAPSIITTTQHTQPPVLITHVASSNLHPDLLLQQQMLHGSASLKSLEPHIKDLPVDVYTDKNVRKMTYKENASINSKGFHLAVVGIKEPVIADASPLPVAVKSDDIIFNFSFASAEIHKNQLSQIDAVIEKHSKNGKRIILMGETDGFGSEAYNKHLAILRANKIIDELKARGVKIDDVEIRILVRCCRKDHPTKETLADTSEQRITWVHFE